MRNDHNSINRLFEIEGLKFLPTEFLSPDDLAKFSAVSRNIQNLVENYNRMPDEQRTQILEQLRKKVPGAVLDLSPRTALAETQRSSLRQTAVTLVQHLQIPETNVYANRIAPGAAFRRRLLYLLLFGVWLAAVIEGPQLMMRGTKDRNDALYAVGLVLCIGIGMVGIGLCFIIAAPNMEWDFARILRWRDNRRMSALRYSLLSESRNDQSGQNARITQRDADTDLSEAVDHRIDIEDPENSDAAEFSRS